jgi:hypothetical protein
MAGSCCSGKAVPGAACKAVAGEAVMQRQVDIAESGKQARQRQMEQ